MRSVDLEAAWIVGLAQTYRADRLTMYPVYRLLELSGDRGGPFIDRVPVAVIVRPCAHGRSALRFSRTS
jgi:hypothetical protein